MIYDRLIFSCMYTPCTSQHVPLTALNPGHTLKNLLTLVTHTQLGRWCLTAHSLILRLYNVSPVLFHVPAADCAKLIVGLRVSPRLVSCPDPTLSRGKESGDHWVLSLLCDRLPKCTTCCHKPISVAKVFRLQEAVVVQQSMLLFTNFWKDSA